MYINSKYIIELKKLFNEKYLKGKGISSLKNNSECKSIFFDFFNSKEFKKAYFLLSEDIAIKLNLDLNRLVLQRQPTPRIFLPNTHGTSFHCDYWYGHGKTFYTIWVPLSKIIENNSFYLCSEQKNDYFLKKIENQKNFIKLEKKLLLNSVHANPPEDSAVVFNSKLLHGSPVNNSSLTRISFDFRIGYCDDQTSTKDLYEYFYYSKGKFLLNKNRFEGLNFLKYICGGKNKNTFSQHLIIEEVSKLYGIRIVSQEAEVERFGYYMFNEYFLGLAKTKNINGIIIASKSIISPYLIKKYKNHKVKIYAALENSFLN